MPTDFKAHAAKVRVDHYVHLFFLWGAGAYAWQVHGFWIGLTVVLSLYAVISVTNMAVLSQWGTPSALQANRWLWVVVAWLAIALSRAEIASIQ